MDKLKMKVTESKGKVDRLDKQIKTLNEIVEEERQKRADKDKELDQVKTEAKQALLREKEALELLERERAKSNREGYIQGILKQNEELEARNKATEREKEQLQ
jgi:hypothetical protein